MARIKERTDKNGIIKYTAEVRLKGFPPQTATFTRLTDAKKWIQNTESAIREGRHFKTSEAKKHTLADAIDRYERDILPVKFTPKEQLNRKKHLQFWRDEIGFHVMADLTTAVFADCRDTLQKTPSRKGGNLSPDSIRKYFLTIESILKRCVNEWHWIEESPLRDNRLEMPALPRGRVRFLDDDERARLLKACQESNNKQLYLCVILALSTGMRQGELMGLKWPDVDLKRGVIVLHNTKNGDRRRVPLTGLALDLLRQHAKVRRLESQLLFPGKVSPDKPMDLRSPWETTLKRAEITDFHWHDLRHCTASYLAMNGASMVDIAAVLGHRTLDMVKRYAHLSDSHIAGVVESMNNRLFVTNQ
ncbi:site-specific integrase [Methylicorpusculum sp.]|uniref:tyrosine-type recombinase/integrase n=1 Tax=Methylicorpusculum sp. TaxID=2713644 RepID=UPI00271AEDD2|nr:site-specific integrase [Methylicorpusculum sp.]MDO8843843.1 site-specific integrase [Methylicorpusculum sp.]